jgi:hypothetical protein
VVDDVVEDKVAREADPVKLMDVWTVEMDGRDEVLDLVLDLVEMDERTVRHARRDAVSTWARSGDGRPRLSSRPMRPPLTSRRALRFALALGALGGAAVLGAAVGCGPDVQRVWICLNPATGKEDGTIGDATHYVNGVFDPCHCYDPCGPSKECPDVEDAGPLPPGCDAGDGG